MKTISKLGIGPMSPEIIEATFKYSELYREPLMLIASQNQIDWDYGYVNNWSTLQYIEYIKDLRHKYLGAEVYICRDHCGPGFKRDDIKSVYKTIDHDIENNFDLIHIDFCKYKGDYSEILKESQKAIDYIKKKSPKTLIEIGTDENNGDHLKDISKIKKEIEFFLKNYSITFFVCQTGSLVKEINQVGDFNIEFIKKVKEVAKKNNIYLKEHNADYCNKNEIRLRQGLIDAVNVAPQYGIIQTELTLQKCLAYGINFNDFLETAYKSGKWCKWMYKNDEKNKLLCSVIAGHYVFASKSYQKLYEKINKYENFKDTIINEIMRNINLYINNL